MTWEECTEGGWSLTESSQALFSRAPSSLSEIRYSRGIAKLRLHWNTTGFVLQASLYDSVMAESRGALRSQETMRSGIVTPGFYCPWLGLFCFVWGSLCNSSPGVICIYAGGSCGFCACELDVLPKEQGASQGCTTQPSNSGWCGPCIWHHGWPALCRGWASASWALKPIFLAKPQGMSDLITLTRDRTCNPHGGSSES